MRVLGWAFTLVGIVIITCNAGVSRRILGVVTFTVGVLLIGLDTFTVYDGDDGDGDNSDDNDDGR